MKRPGRILLRITATLLALLAICLIAGLDGVDYHPYFKAPYYTQTMGRFHAQSATNATAHGELQAGFGSVVLTPSVNAPNDEPAQGKFRALPLAGYGQRSGKPASGMHDDLHVKAVAFRVAGLLGVMVGTDALIVPREVADAAAQQLAMEPGLRREQLYFSATHTHSGFGGWGEGMVAESFAGKFQPGTRTWFAACIVKAVRDAITDLKPAACGYGSFTAPKFVRNRVVGDLGKTDPEFSFLVVRQEQGRQAILGSFSAHATVVGSANLEFSSDYPGSWERAVEGATGGFAVFLAGAVGSHAPVAGDKGFKGAERMGGELANMLLEQLPQVALTNFASFGMLGIDVSLPPLNVRVSDDVRLRPWLAAHLLPPERDSFLQAFRINDSIWISTPCDFSGELALRIKESLQMRGLSAVITSFNGDYIGYVIPARYYHMNGYEPRLMSFYGPNVPDYLDELIRSLASELAGNR